MPTTRFFINNELQENFEKNGFIKIPLLNKSELKGLENLFQKYFPNFETNEFSYSNFMNNKEINFEIQEEIKSILLPSIKKHLTNFRTILGLFYIKPTGNQSKFYCHRDWSIVDESKYSSLNIWLPLIETNANNGNLVVLPKSHKKKTLRGSPELSLPPISFLDKVNLQFKKQNIFTKPSEAVLFDHRLIHSSKPNISNKIRVVAALSVIPIEAKVVHYYQNKNGKIELYEVEDNFYLQLDSSDFNKIQSKSPIATINGINW